MRIRILVIDDEESWCEILKYNLEKEGYDVDTATSAEEALEYDLTQYNLMIVDIMMERISGYDFAKRVRNNPALEFTPIIFCSALDGEDDKVMGLNIGADDFITKPFNIGEVIARVKAVLRRTQPVQQANHTFVAPQPQPAAQQTQAQAHAQAIPASQSAYEPDIAYRTLRLDRNAKICYIDNRDVGLTKIEFDLMLFFLTHRDRIHARAEIMPYVWDTQVTSRSIDVNIARLRKKIVPYDQNIITRIGFGYGFRTD